jgi:hypothetical protein
VIDQGSKLPLEPSPGKLHAPPAPVVVLPVAEPVEPPEPAEPEELLDGAASDPEPGPWPPEPDASDDVVPAIDAAPPPPVPS